MSDSVNSEGINFSWLTNERFLFLDLLKLNPFKLLYHRCLDISFFFRALWLRYNFFPFFLQAYLNFEFNFIFDGIAIGVRKTGDFSRITHLLFVGIIFYFLLVYQVFFILIMTFNLPSLVFFFCESCFPLWKYTLS